MPSHVVQVPEAAFSCEARPLLRLSAVCVSYRTSSGLTEVLRGIELEVINGEFLAVVGRTGCGKTTLLRTIAGMVELNHGRIEFRRLRRSEATTIRVGFVFQRPGLMPWFSIRRNLSVPLELVGVPRIEAENKAEQILEECNLASFASAYPRELSVGMQQLVSYGRALMLNPDILLMDEPFSALDEFSREEIGQRLLTVWAKHQKTIVFVTHSIAEAVYLSDRIAVMTSRPGMISNFVKIGFARPRTLSLLQEPEFLAICNDVRNAM